ncbi:MAG: hypothetical protein NC416_01330 [Eubacterium sp.]|nr:hypothetical protein [Eubacterium sp.]
MKRKTILYMTAAAAAILFLGGCGKEAGEQETKEEETTEADAGQDITELAAEMEDGLSAGAGEKPAAGGADALSPEEEALQERFGEDCITSQTFAVTLDGFEGEVWFVPFAPSAEVPEFRVQLMQEGRILTELRPHEVTQERGLTFTSLDAVSFWDVNFDGCTDIVMVAAYGDTQLASVYYGDYGKNEGSESGTLYYTWNLPLSDSITAQASPLTIPGIRGLLSGGKRNGEFASCAEAYEAVVNLSILAQGEEPYEDYQYDLIYVDEDEVPELVTGQNWYYVNLYTYADGTVYTLMDDWGYGAMGNAGYEYAPGDNSIRNDNADYAGAIMDTTYMRINDQHEIETTAWVETYNFVDANGNGLPDEGEDLEEGAGKSLINGKEASDEELAAFYPKYDMGNYQMIIGTKTAEEVRRALLELK